MFLEHLLRYLRALPTIRVHPELEGHTLAIVHSLIMSGLEMFFEVFSLQFIVAEEIYSFQLPSKTL